MNKHSSLQQFKHVCETQLFDSVLPFWETHSPDWNHGGYFNCLDRDGSIYDRRKNVWLQGRQIWMFSKLYTTVDQRPQWLNMAKLGMDFLKTHAVRPDHRLYFALNEQGEPIHLQRKIFSECFYIMALAEYSRATGDDSYAREARELLEIVWKWSTDLTLVGRPKMSGMLPLQPLAVPMILLNLIEEVAGENHSAFSVEVDECIERMLKHVHHEKQLVLENVLPDGSYAKDWIEGRQLNPGHAIEAGWFLQHWAQRLNKLSLSSTAINMIRWSFDKGWDEEYGGLYYFLDSEGYSPNELEWSLKLWWPHTEALYALLQTYLLTHDEEDWERFSKLKEYTFSHFPDETYGEWFGYLDRAGNISQQFKGGPYKGCFHVPRSLFLCHQLLDKSLD